MIISLNQRKFSGFWIGSCAFPTTFIPKGVMEVPGKSITYLPLFKVPTSSLPPLGLPSPLLFPRRIFLASLILALKFTQDECYSWAKLSGLLPNEIGHCEHALGNALKWHLCAPAGHPAPSNRPAIKKKSDGELILHNGPSEAGSFSCFSIPPPPWQLLQNLQGTGLRRASILRPSGFSQDPPVSAPTVPEDSWEAPPWTPATVTTSISSNNNPPTPLHPHSPSSTNSSSGGRGNQMSTFIDTTLPPGQFFSFGISAKAHRTSLLCHILTWLSLKLCSMLIPPPGCRSCLVSHMASTQPWHTTQPGLMPYIYIGLSGRKVGKGGGR